MNTGARYHGLLCVTKGWIEKVIELPINHVSRLSSANLDNRKRGVLSRYYFWRINQSSDALSSLYVPATALSFLFYSLSILRRLCFAFVLPLSRLLLIPLPGPCRFHPCVSFFSLWPFRGRTLSLHLSFCPSRYPSLMMRFLLLSRLLAFLVKRRAIIAGFIPPPRFLLIFSFILSFTRYSLYPLRGDFGFLYPFILAILCHFYRGSCG